jgi:glutaredoxin
MAVRVTLLSRAGCHLCDDARAVVHSVVGEQFEELDVDADPRLALRYGEEVPVVLVDGRQISYWTIEERRLRAALR